MEEELVGALDFSDFSVGDFVKIEQKDGPVPDRVNWSGKVKVSEKHILEVETFDGVIGLEPYQPDMELEITKLKRKPSGWKDFRDNPEKYREIKPKKPVKDQVFDLVKNNPRKKAESLLKLAKDTISGNPKTMKTYINLAIAKYRA